MGEAGKEMDRTEFFLKGSYMKVWFSSAFCTVRMDGKPLNCIDFQFTQQNQFCSEFHI